MPTDAKIYKQKALDERNATNLRRSREGRDIAPDFPKERTVNKKLRDSCANDLRKFLLEYFPKAFPVPFSPDHDRAISILEAAIIGGGNFADGMPRGTGKTAIIKRAAIWAQLYGHRKYIVPVGATVKLADKLLISIKSELQFNELLFRDFPHVCYPVRCLENNGRKAIGQLFDGEQTLIGWGSEQLIFPTMPDSTCYGIANPSGATTEIFGMTGTIRGLSRTLPTGEEFRPDFAILDDPQTRESAMSPTQCDDREALINGDIMQLAGPGKKITGVMLCTVIRENDLSDRFLNQEKNPDWQGLRTKMIYAWPVAEDMWAKYATIRVDCLRRKRDISEATEFYRKHRKAMDAGAKVAWAERFASDELSAVQHAMNLRFKYGDEAFFAEYQNEPIPRESDIIPTLTAAQIADKTNGIKRGILPVAAQHLTMFIDVHENLLFYAVCAWGADFSGWVIDYGTYPDQKRRRFTLKKATATLAMASPRAGLEGSIRAGLDAVAGLFLAREWQREDGAAMKIERCLIDTGWKPDVVYDFARHSDHAAVLIGSRGFGCGAKMKPMTEYQKKPGERLGWNWLIAKTTDRAGRVLRFDTNHWKGFVHARLAAIHGDKASLSLFGRDPREHDLFAEHLTAEAAVRVTANGRTVDEWALKPGVADNHWLDCVVGCAVAGSVLGAKLEAAGYTSKVKRKRVSFAEMQRKARERVPT